MRQHSNLLYLLTLSTLHSNVHGFWRAACSVVQTGRIDPVLSPGAVSGHVHKIAGGNEINPYSTFDSLQTSNCSSCQIQADKSAYWTPQLYYAHSNGSFQDVPNEGMTVYYVGRGDNVSSTVPFPEGFKMLTGNSLKRSYDNTTLTYLNTRPVADRVSFHCIDENNDIPEQHYMFDTNCVNGMRAQINFQSCWDGVNLYLPESAHVAYLSGIDSGVCPPSHPVQLPHLFFEACSHRFPPSAVVLYWTNDIDQSAGGQFVFANGDTTGYGFHGDFLNGWDMEVQTSAVANCLYTDNGGLISACPVLYATDDVNFSRDCLPQPEYWDEPVLGMLSQLPGCNPITSGPQDATQIICAVNSSTPVSTSTNPSSAPTTTFTSSYSSTTSFTDTQFTTILSVLTTNSSAPTPASGGVFVIVSAADNSTALPSSVYPTNTTLSFPANSTADPFAFTTTFVTITTPVTIDITSFIDNTVPFGAASTPTVMIASSFTA